MTGALTPTPVVGPEAEEHETHGSIVRLAGDRASKLRKAVRLPDATVDVTERMRVMWSPLDEVAP